MPDKSKKPSQNIPTDVKEDLATQPREQIIEEERLIHQAAHKHPRRFEREQRDQKKS